MFAYLSIRRCSHEESQRRPKFFTMLFRIKVKPLAIDLADEWFFDAQEDGFRQRVIVC